MLTTAQQSLYATLLIDTGFGHERIPHGVPSAYSWYGGPVIQAGNKPGGMTAMNPWGQLYTVADGNSQPDAQVELRGMQLWTLSAATGIWTALYPTPPVMGGAWFPENFQGASELAPIDTSIPGSIIVAPTTGYLFHTYPDQARGVVPSQTDIAAIAVSCRARLVEGSYGEDAADPGLCFNVGADYWQNGSSGTSAGVGQGRFKTVKPTWRTFTFSTITHAQAQTGNLPPIGVDPGELY